MKSLRQILGAALLTCAMAFSAFAGDMHTTVAATSEMGTTAATGDMSTTATNTGDTGIGVASTVDPVAQIALNLLQTVFALV